MPPIPPVTKWVMMICSIVWFATLLMPNVGIGLDALALWPLASGQFMPWQVVSYSVLHFGFEHLFFNMLALWMFGSELERLWGEKRYLQYLLAGVLAAAAAQMILTALIGSYRPTVGASGAVFALLAGYGLLFPNRQVMLLIPPIPMKARTLVLVFGAIELVLGVLSPGGGVAHFAHLGGALGGWLMIQYWRGSGPFKGNRRRF